MNCPKCNTSLIVANTQGVEVDHCPSCLGVWLDRGELEKIIDRSTGFWPNEEDDHRDHGYRSNHGNNHHREGFGNTDHTKRRKSFLSEMFDF